MKYFNGDRVEIVLTPSNVEIEKASFTAAKLMSEKIDQWILDQLTIKQLQNCIEKFTNELKKRTEDESC